MGCGAGERVAGGTGRALGSQSRALSVVRYIAGCVEDIFVLCACPSMPAVAVDRGRTELVGPCLVLAVAGKRHAVAMRLATRGVRIGFWFTGRDGRSFVPLESPSGSVAVSVRVGVQIYELGRFEFHIHDSMHASWWSG